MAQSQEKRCSTRADPLAWSPQGPSSQNTAWCIIGTQYTISVLSDAMSKLIKWQRWDMNLGCSVIPEHSAPYLPRGKRLLWFSRKAGLAAGHRGERKGCIHWRPKLWIKDSDCHKRNLKAITKAKTAGGKTHWILWGSLAEQLPLSLGRAWALASPAAGGWKPSTGHFWGD